MDAGSPLEWELSELRGVTIVRLSGVLDIRTYGVLRDALLKCAADQPRAMIVDLDALEITSDQLTSVFVAVWLRISQWSTVTLVVVPGPAHEALSRHGPLRRFVTVRPTVLAALDNLGEPPPRRRTELWLPPSPLSVRAAKRFVTDTCHNWSIDSLAAPAVKVAGELVANAADHVRSPARLRLELRLGRLTVAVADDDVAPVSLPRPGRRSPEPRSGLHLVAHLAHAAGWSPKQTGGKVVWAVLRPPPVPPETGAGGD
jgi:anti-anti-sigma regulatory factor